MTRSQAAAMELDDIDNDDDNDSIVIDDLFECSESIPSCSGFWVQCQCERWCCLHHIKEMIHYLSEKDDQFVQNNPIELNLDEDITQERYEHQSNVLPRYRYSQLDIRLFLTVNETLNLNLTSAIKINTTMSVHT